MLKTTAAIALVLLVCFPAAAKDAVQSAVTPVVPPTPIVTVEGNPYATGTYGVGNIKLLYTLNGYSFPAGVFAAFRLDMANAPYGGGQTPTYPVGLNLSQAGSSNLTLTASPESFSVSGLDWKASSLITISISSQVAADPSLNTDGTDLVANLKLATSPSGAHLDTATTVQVHIKLVHPTSCLRLYNFITDEAFTTIVNSTYVNVNANGKEYPKVNSTIPFGQFSDNVLVVNACGMPQTFDLKILLDSSFDTNPRGNPGNAVFTYATSGAVTPATFNMGAFGTGTARGQQLCLPNLTVAGGQTLLGTVHMGIIRGMAASLLPLDGTMDFSAELRSELSNCAGALNTMATPNPAGATLSYSVK